MEMWRESRSSREKRTIFSLPFSQRRDPFFVPSFFVFSIHSFIHSSIHPSIRPSRPSISSPSSSSSSLSSFPFITFVRFISSCPVPTVALPPGVERQCSHRGNDTTLLCYSRLAYASTRPKATCFSLRAYSRKTMQHAQRENSACEEEYLQS